MPSTRAKLAALLCELCTLAGWQALDRAQMATAWRYYEQAKAAARESGDKSFEAHATAEQAFVLIDMGDTSNAVEQIVHARSTARRYAPRILMAWLSAACGEAYAADNRRGAALRAFDEADVLLAYWLQETTCPYIALEAVHLARWQGHVLARLGETEAISLLNSALSHLDRTFTRAEVALRVDLAIAMSQTNMDQEACRQKELASALAEAVGSQRQQRRLVAMV